jgi:hypothetical protein
MAFDKYSARITVRGQTIHILVSRDCLQSFQFSDWIISLPLILEVQYPKKDSIDVQFSQIPFYLRSSLLYFYAALTVFTDVSGDSIGPMENKAN